MDIIEFCRRNDIANKLRTAIDDIENGNGYIVFDGLQYKGALVRVTYNGVNVILSPGPLLVGFDEIPKVITHLPVIEIQDTPGNAVLFPIACTGEEPWCPLQKKNAQDQPADLDTPISSETENPEYPKLGQDIVDAVNESREKELEVKPTEKTKKRRSTT